MPSLRRIVLASTPLLLLLTALPAQKRAAPKQEQTFPEVIKAATAAFDAKEFGAAVTALQEALRLAQQQQRLALVAALPKPAGWEFEDEKNEAADNPMLRGLAAFGSTVTRRYTKGDNSLSIEIMANSPVAQMITMLFNNPAMLQAQGGEVVEYGAHKALLKKEGDSYEMQILMHGKHLVTVKTDTTDKELFSIIDQKAVDALEKQLGK